VPRLSQAPAYVAGLVRARTGRPGAARFTFDGAELPYFYATYNNTWLNERAVEVPLALRALAGAATALEVGNVLAHYGRTGHEVIDKYERAPGVTAMDVLDLDPDARYDAVVSISTVEHVGVDDTPRDPRRGVDAVRLLARAVRPGGALLITVPVGYNPTLDAALLAGEVAEVRIDGLLKVGAGARWRQVAPAEAAGATYDHAGRTARGLLVVREAAPPA